MEDGSPKPFRHGGRLGRAVLRGGVETASRLNEALTGGIPRRVSALQAADRTDGRTGADHSPPSISAGSAFVRVSYPVAPAAFRSDPTRSRRAADRGVPAPRLTPRAAGSGRAGSDILCRRAMPAG